MLFYLSVDDRGGVAGVHFDEGAAASRSKGKVRPYGVPGRWEMFTDRGDRRIAELAERFLTWLANGGNPQEGARRFFRSFARLFKTKTMSEAGDTAVRDCVWSFAWQFRGLFEHGAAQLEHEWDNKECG